jgi:hypothetical protein
MRLNETKILLLLGLSALSAAMFSGYRNITSTHTAPVESDYSSANTTLELGAPSSATFTWSEGMTPAPPPAYRPRKARMIGRMLY